MTATVETVPIEQIRSGSDLFFCVPYSCKILEQAKADRIAAIDRRPAFEISERDGEFYFHGFDRPFSRDELLLIAAQCEARGTGRVELGVLAEVIGRVLTPTQALELAELIRTRALECFK